MGSWTKKELLELRTAWKNALLAAATGKSYAIGSRNLTRYDIAEIRKTLSWIDAELDALEGRKGPVFVHAHYVRRRG